MNQQPISGDSSFLKSINKSTLLGLIRTQSPLSRADLAKRTKLTRATVSALVEELIQDHLVIEIGIGESNGGRKPMLLEINRQAGFIFGIDLRATEILFLATDLQGDSKMRVAYDYVDAFNQDQTLRQLVEIIALERAKLPASSLGLLGIGIGVHGFVEHASSRIEFAPYFGWRNADWKSILEVQTGVPVYIDNEANLAALGELESGVAKNYSEILYLSIGAGIGAGLILNGEIFRGFDGYAGEVGHTTIQMEGRICPCGNRGCWEMYASEKALADQLGLSYRPGITGQIVELLKKGDTSAHLALSEFGRSLGQGIRNMIHIFNPQMVVIGNVIEHYREWLDGSFDASLKTRFPPVRYHDEVLIRYSSLGDEACARGAAFVVIRHAMKM